MKSILGWLASWFLFCLGHIVSRPMQWDWTQRAPQYAFDVLYAAYNRLMLASSDVQEWGGKGPWMRIHKGG